MPGVRAPGQPQRPGLWPAAHRLETGEPLREPARDPEDPGPEVLVPRGRHQCPGDAEGGAPVDAQAVTGSIPEGNPAGVRGHEPDHEAPRCLDRG